MERDDDTLAGWHRDPSGRHELRFWNGDRWTEHVIDEGIPGLDFPTRSGRAPVGPDGATPATPAPTPPTATTEVTAPRDVETPADAAVLEPGVLADASAAAPAVDEDEPAIDLVAEAQVDFDAQADAPADASAIEETDETASDGVMAASVVTPTREAERVGESGPTPPTAAPAAPSHGHTAGRSLRSRRRASPPVAPVPAPIPPSIPPPLVAAEPTVVVPPAPPIAEPPPQPRATEPAPSAEPIAAHATPPEPEPVRVAEPGPRVLAEPPTVASPAGNSAGSNTSAIADPHRAATTAGRASDPPAPRVAGVHPVPVKRYRPGSPPASPLAGPRALPAPAIGPVGVVVAPWYRRPAGWIAVVAIIVVAALAGHGIAALARNDGGNARLGGRPPAAAPQGTKVIDGEGFGIAAPSGWIVATDPGNTFPQLRHTNWGTPLAATDTTNGQALIVVPLHGLAHQPSVDPELFWSDQIRGAGTTRTVTAGAPLSVHGFRATQIAATDPSGKALVAASIDTGDRTFLVAFTAPTADAAATRFDALIQTFDAR
jgi:hypothetical protein